MAEHLSYYEYDESRAVSCACGWHGTAGEGSREYYAELFDVSCPRCDSMLLIVPKPTAEETRKAAAAGDPRAIENLAFVERAEEYKARFDRERLTSPEQLPELEKRELFFVWDHERDLTLITVDDHVIWSEPQVWEGWWRFIEVKEILKKRYARRFRSLIPTPRSELYLYGDILGKRDEMSFD